MKHAAKLRELPVYTHRLQTDTTDTLAFVVRLFVQNVVFGAVKLVSEGFSHACDGISKLVDNGIEKRYGGRETFSAFDCAPIAFDRMCRALAGGYQHAFSHDETQPHEVFTGLCEFLMQIRHHADNLVTEDIETQVPVTPWPSRRRSLSFAVTTVTRAPTRENAARIVPQRR